MNDIKAMQNLLFRIGAEVVNEAKDIAPYKTGNLKKDIQVFDDNIDNLELTIGNSKLAYYAPYVHQGTGKRARGKSKAPHKNGQKPQPYLEDSMQKYISSGSLDRALNDAGEEITDNFKKQLKKTLNNVSIN